MMETVPKRMHVIGSVSAMAYLGTALLVSSPATAGSGKIVVEGESADKVVEHFTVKSTKDKKVSGGKYLACPAESCGEHKVDLRGSATYTIAVAEPGAYNLWVRRYWEDGCGNSVWAQIDDTPSVQGEKSGPVCDKDGDFRRHLGLLVGEDATYNSWQWTVGKNQGKKYAFRLKPGKHTLTLWVREDGIRVDQILLTKDEGYTPVRSEKATQ